MLTPAKLVANRANAARSTGPRTSAGKAAASGNALTHGLRSQRILLPGESAAAFDQFCAALRADLGAEGALEEALADRIVALLWRLRRVPWLEAGLLRAHAFENRRRRLLQHLLSAPPNVPAAVRPRLDAERLRAHRPHNDLGRAFEQTIVRGDAVTILARYETTLDRALHRALTQLAVAQARRAQIAVANEREIWIIDGNGV